MLLALQNCGLLADIRMRLRQAVTLFFFMQVQACL